MSKAASSSSGGATGACMLASSVSVGSASVAVLAGGGVEDWLKTGNIPSTVAMQVEIRCLQVRSTSRIQEAKNPGQDPRGAEDLLYQGGPVNMCHLESKTADAKRTLAN